MTIESTLNKDYKIMTLAELEHAHKYWTDSCRDSPGWTSAYFSASQLKHVCVEANKRGLELINEFPIRYG